MGICVYVHVYVYAYIIYILISLSSDIFKELIPKRCISGLKGMYIFNLN